MAFESIISMQHAYLVIKTRGYFLMLLLLSLVFNCCKDEPKPNLVSDVKKGQGLFVVNEGTFTSGNASLYYINLSSDSLNKETDLFKLKNNRPLGDIFQSMSFINNKAWLVVNNSSKIEVINPENIASIATIKNLRSPRYSLEINTEKVYVTDLYANVIHIIDSKNYTKIGEIKCSGWTEEMIAFQNQVWVTNHHSDYVYLINTMDDKIIDSIKVAYGGSSILKDKHDVIWVLCSGDAIKKKTGGLFGINALTKKIEKQWLFTQPDFNPIKLIQNAANDSLYYIHNGIYSLSKTANILSNNPLIPQPNGSSFYGLTIQTSTGIIFVADALDYVSQGKVSLFTPKGLLIKSYKVGVNPSGFFWW
jgi:hypothetical protein